MKKSAIVLAGVTLMMGTLSMVGASAHANHCGTGAGQAQDPFGSCEDGTNNLNCADLAVSAAGAVTFASATPSSGAGVEVCNGSGLPQPRGRAAIYRDPSGNVTIAVDGDADQAGSQGWSRVDIRPGATDCGRTQVRRGTTGSYWTTNAASPANPKGGSSQPDVIDTCTI